MNFEEALKEVGKHEPCPHYALNFKLGNGQEWARCEDCGQTVRQSSISALRQENARFLEALTVIRAMYESSDKAKIEEAIRLLNETMASGG